MRSGGRLPNPVGRWLCDRKLREERSVQTSFCWYGCRCQLHLPCCRPIHATRAARGCTDQSDNSGCWWLWTRLSSWPVWRLSSQRPLRRCLLRHPCGRRGGSAAGRGSACLPSSLQSVPMLAGLLTDLKHKLTSGPAESGAVRTIKGVADNQEPEGVGIHASG
jgi:hypothetical protein